MTLVERLVQVPSFSGSETEVASVLSKAMLARGFTTEMDAVGNVLGRLGQGSIHVYLIGHMDTVPGDLPVAVRNGRLFGRGSVDAKGPLSVCVEAAAAFADSQTLTITVVGCVREEADSAGGRHLLKTLAPPDIALIAEPSGWNGITLGYKGSLPVHYRIEKGQAHHGAPLSTAAEDAVAFHQMVCAAHAHQSVGFEDVSIRLTSIRSGQSEARAWADATLDIRTPPGFAVSSFRDRVCEAAAGADVRFGDYVPAVLRGKRNVWVRAMLAGIRKQEGTPVFKRKTGTSDMNLIQAWDVPLLAYGPGDSSLDHTPHESLCLTEYERAIGVLRHALAGLEEAGRTKTRRAC